MKRYQYILFSIFLSTMVVYLSVGMPLVKYNCMKCAHMNVNEAIVGIVEINDDGSSCDCSEHSKCSCGMHHNHVQQLAYQINKVHVNKESEKTNNGDAEHAKNGAKAEHNSHDMNSKDCNRESNDENGGCSKVNIVKINLPILTSPIHLDEAVYPIIDLSVFNYLADLSQLHEFEDENSFIDDLVPTLRPRDYINTICTLII